MELSLSLTFFYYGKKNCGKKNPQRSRHSSASSLPCHLSFYEGATSRERGIFAVVVAVVVVPLPKPLQPLGSKLSGRVPDPPAAVPPPLALWRGIAKAALRTCSRLQSGRTLVPPRRRRRRPRRHPHPRHHPDHHPPPQTERKRPPRNPSPGRRAARCPRSCPAPARAPHHSHK